MEDTVDPLVSFGIKEAIKVIGYIWEYDDLVESLKRDMKSLDARLSTIKQEVIYYKDEQQRVIRDDVTEWIDSVNLERASVNKFLRKTQKDSAGCCGLDCNCWKRYRYGREAKDRAENIVELTKRGVWRSSGDLYLSKSNPWPMAKYWESGYVPLPSMDKHVEELKEFLQVGGSDEMLVMGIYGVEGVGKTTVAKKLAADMESGGVKVVVVNGKDDDEKIQTQIAERFGHEITSKTSAERAGRLFQTLDAKKVLIIFDDLERKIELTEIGVPEPAPDNYCRILVVSKNRQACEDMHSQKNLQIIPLTQEESETFAAGLAFKYNYKQSKCSLDGITSGREGLPAEIKQLIRTQTTETLKLISRGNYCIVEGGGGSGGSDGGAGGRPMFPLAVEAAHAAYNHKPSTSHGEEILKKLNADKLEIEHVETSDYWRWDRTGSSPEAVLIRVWYLHIEGTATGLSRPLTLYGAYFVYKLSENASGFNINPMEMVVGRKSRRSYLDPLKYSDEKPRMREDGWLEIEMGRFSSDDCADSHEMKLIVKDHDSSIVKTGLRIRRIELRKLDPS